MSQVHTFWVLFIGFILFLGGYMIDTYFLRVFYDVFKMMLGLWGIMFGFYMVYWFGYLEGNEKGYDEGLREGYEKALNGD